MSLKLVLVLLLLHANFACFAYSRTLPFRKQSLPFQMEPCIGASREITNVNPESDEECQIMHKTTLLGMDHELDKQYSLAIKMQDTQNKKRSMVEIQHQNKSNGVDEVGEVIHVKDDYPDPSGDSPIHNHN